MSPPIQVKPPRLLAGVAFVFWGAMTEHATVGLICAILVEACHWIRIRFDFDENSYVRAWQLGVLAFILTIFVQWSKGTGLSTLIEVLEWLPVCFLSTELAQRYGSNDAIPVTTFSFIARMQKRRDLAKGKIVRTKAVNVSFPFIGVILLSTGFAAQSDWRHFIGLSILLFVSLIVLTKARSRNLVLFLLVGLLAIVPAYFGQKALVDVAKVLRGQGGGQGENRIDPKATRSGIGKVGTMNLSKKIYWRVKIASKNKRDIPKLLRAATYNHYSNDKNRGGWETEYSDKKAGLDDFDSLTIGSFNDPYLYFEYDAANDFKEIEKLPSVLIKGAVSNEQVLPLAGYPYVFGRLSQRLQELKSEGFEGSDVESNPLGTVQIINPEQAAIEYEVFLDKNNVSEANPADFEMMVPENELKVIDSFIEKYELRNLKALKLIEELREIYLNDFTYSLEQKRYSKKGEGTLWRFLGDQRSGHCEYFATATSLILRRLGTPTRYSIGYSIDEYNESRGEWILRGIHAHAWSRAYVGGELINGIWTGGKWVDVDLTPPDFNAVIGSNFSFKDKLADWLQFIREDVAVWQSQEGNAMKFLLITGSIIALLIVYVLFRIRKNMRRDPSRRLENLDTQFVRKTPLSKLNRKLEKYLSKRPLNMPFIHWIRGLQDFDPSLKSLLDDLKQCYDEYRFDPDQVNEDEGLRLDEYARELKKWMKDNPVGSLDSEL